MSTANHFDAIVIGGGPAGLTAGIYLSRGRLKTLILNEGTVGGQMVLTHEIANYPGVESISGYQLSNIMKKQAKDFGCVIKSNITLADLELPGEGRFKGRGISYCATCDGDFFTDKKIIVVGGGNSALEEAVSLTKYACLFIRTISSPCRFRRLKLVIWSIPAVKVSAGSSPNFKKTVS